MRDAGRIMPIPLMLEPFVVAVVKEAVTRLPCVATAVEFDRALPTEPAAFGARIVVPVGNGVELAFGAAVVGGATAAPTALRCSAGALSWSTTAPMELRRRSSDGRIGVAW
jgi:hypothetical protein